jgi:hypothetical protein
MLCVPAIFSTTRTKALPSSQELEPLLLPLSETLASKDVPAGSKLSDAYLRAQSGECLAGCDVRYYQWHLYRCGGVVTVLR